MEHEFVYAASFLLSPTEQPQQQAECRQSRHQVAYKKVYILLSGSVTHGKMRSDGFIITF